MTCTDDPVSEPRYRGKVFIIDDHYTIRVGLRGILTTHGYKVIGEAEDLAMIIDVKGIGRNADVILLDLNLKTTVGLHTLEKAMAMFPDVRFIVHSMERSIRTIGESYRKGALAYIPKAETQPNDILEAVEHAVQGKKFVLPQLSGEVIDYLTRGPADSPIESLNQIERRIFEMLYSGCSVEEISKETGYGITSVRTRISAIKRKLGITDRTVWRAAAMAYQQDSPEFLQLMEPNRTDTENDR